MSSGFISFCELCSCGVFIPERGASSGGTEADRTRNVLSGAIWQPFLHLSANLLQIRYKSTEAVASLEASVLLAGAIVLYPLVSQFPSHLYSTGS